MWFPIFQNDIKVTINNNHNCSPNLILHYHLRSFLLQLNFLSTINPILLIQSINYRFHHLIFCHLPDLQNHNSLNYYRPTRLQGR